MIIANKELDLILGLSQKVIDNTEKCINRALWRPLVLDSVPLQVPIVASKLFSFNTVSRYNINKLPTLFFY